MLATRHAKVVLLGASAFFFLTVVLNNAVLDYRSNYEFVRHVLSMDTLFSGEAQSWRALRDPTPDDKSYWVHHVFYWSIIAWEAIAGALCGISAWKLWKARKASSAEFQKAKSLGIYGLSLTVLQWLTAFISVGAEWFLMWQSRTWNGQDAAGRMCIIFGILLIFVTLHDDEVEAG